MKQNKKFIEEQIGKTVDALNRDRLHSLLGQEVEREMMAWNREQFGFRVIDVPRVPDRKSNLRGGGVQSLPPPCHFSSVALFSFYAINPATRN